MKAALRAVPAGIFRNGTKGVEVRQFDRLIADGLPGYEHEHSGGKGRNPACKLWADEGFDHSVDVYSPEERIAIEIEKSEVKRISDDLLKFIRGGETREANGRRIEFGCLVVPTNYRGSGNLFRGGMRTLEFARSVIPVEDVAVLGYEDPRWR